MGAQRGTPRKYVTMPERSKPNILITGTPGTGKTSLSAQVAAETKFRHINVGDWVKEKSLHSGWDEEFECYVLDDDKASCGKWGPMQNCLGWRAATGVAAAAQLSLAHLLAHRCVMHWKMCWRRVAASLTTTAATCSLNGVWQAPAAAGSCVHGLTG